MGHVGGVIPTPVGSREVLLFMAIVVAECAVTPVTTTRT